MTVKTRRWDVSEYLDSERRRALYLQAAFEDGDPAVIAAAIGDVARARGMTQLAKSVGMSRPALYRALDADGNPEFVTIVKVLKTMGLRLAAVPRSRAKSKKAA